MATMTVSYRKNIFFFQTTFLLSNHGSHREILQTNLPNCLSDCTETWLETAEHHPEIEKGSLIWPDSQDGHDGPIYIVECCDHYLTGDSGPVGALASQYSWN